MTNDCNNCTIKKTKKIHGMWKTEQLLAKRGKIPKVFVSMGKYQYTYTSPKGKISMIQLATPYTKGWEWEIHAFENKKLFADCLRFKTKKEAEKRIEELLNPRKVRYVTKEKKR